MVRRFCGTTKLERVFGSHWLVFILQVIMTKFISDMDGVFTSVVALVEVGSRLVTEALLLLFTAFVGRGQLQGEFNELHFE